MFAQVADEVETGNDCTTTGLVPVAEGGRVRKKTVRCFICGDPSHLCSACPYRRNCHRCLQPGHVARNCAPPDPVKKGDQTGQVSALTSSVYGLLVRGMIGSIELSF